MLKINSIIPMLEKIYRLAVSFFLYAWMGRYLGPIAFGELSYVLAILAFFETISNLGLPNIMKAQIVHAKNLGNVLQIQTILKSSAILFLLGALLSSLCILICAKLLNQSLLLMFAPFYLFRVFDVWEHYLDAQGLNAKVGYIKMISFTFISAIRCLMLYFSCSTIAIAGTFLIEPIIGLILLLADFLRSKQTLVASSEAVKKTMLELLKKSWPIIFSTLAVLTYMKLDQIMLMHLAPKEIVGIYSAAVKLSEAWFFIPMALCNAFFPSIVGYHAQGNIKDFQKQFHKLNRILFLVFFLGVLALIPLAPYLIPAMFSNKYAASVPIFQVHIFSGLFIFMGQAQGIWDVCYNQLKFSFFRAFAGGFSNLVLNAILIPKYNGLGAAIATIISYSITFIWMNLLRKNNRLMLKTQLNSLFSGT